jgi:hypothetical protein
MYHSVCIEAHKNKVYIRASLGGKEQRPAYYARENKIYLQLGPLEVYRGLNSHAITLYTRHALIDLMRSHSQSCTPGRLHFAFYFDLRLLRRDIKRRIRDFRRAN